MANGKTKTKHVGDGRRRGSGSGAAAAAYALDERAMAANGDGVFGEGGQASESTMGGGGASRDGGGDGDGVSALLGPMNEVWYGGGEAGGGEEAVARRMVFNPTETAKMLMFSVLEPIDFRCVRGPIGDGKSVSCCWFIYFCGRAQVAQWVVERDGTRHVVRWSKFLIARHTFKALDETTVETWNQWFGDRTRWTTNPYQGRFEEPMEDGTLVRIDFVCYATESRNIMDDLQSLELSGAWINEATQTGLHVVARVFTRLKRFNPVPANRAPMRSFGVVMDTNSPDESNWWYRKEVVEHPKGWVFIVCPPAVLRTRRADGGWEYVPNDLEHCGLRGPNARPVENVRQIDGGYHDGTKYWTDMLTVLPDDEIRKLLMNEYGQTVAGMAVFPEWNAATHLVREEMKYERGMMVVCGMDLGRRPAFVIAQMGRDGVLRVMRDIVPWESRGSDGRRVLKSVDVLQFFDEWVRPVLMTEFEYPRCRHIVFADPAGKNLNETSSVSAIEMLAARGLNIVATDRIQTTSADARDIQHANDVDIRLRCVSQALREMRYGKPTVQVSAACADLVKGFSGAYCYRKMRCLGGDGSERYDDKPDKGDYSHVMDAFQYLCLGVFRGASDYSRPASVVLGTDDEFDASMVGYDMDLV